MISDEREWSDEQNRMSGNDTLYGELGYNVSAPRTAHSKRSRQIEAEKYFGWDDNYHPHRDGD